MPIESNLTDESTMSGSHAAHHNALAATVNAGTGGFASWTGKSCWYSFPCQSVTNNALTTTTLYGQLIRIPNAVTLAKVAVTVAVGSAGTNLETYFYHDGDFQPTTRIAAFTFSAASGGFAFFDSTSTMVFPGPTNLWVLWRATSTNPSFRCAGTTSMMTYYYGEDSPSAGNAHTPVRIFFTYTAGVPVPTDMTSASHSPLVSAPAAPMIYFQTAA